MGRWGLLALHSHIPNSGYFSVSLKQKSRGKPQGHNQDPRRTRRIPALERHKRIRRQDRGRSYSHGSLGLVRPHLQSLWAPSPLGLSSLQTGSGISREGTQPRRGRALPRQLCHGPDSPFGSDTRPTVDLCSFLQGCLDWESRREWPATPGAGGQVPEGLAGPGERGSHGAHPAHISGHLGKPFTMVASRQKA